MSKLLLILTAAQIKSAIEWRYAKNNLDTLLSNDYEKEIASKLQAIENNIATLIETLAAAKAWRNTIDKMGREERAHLIAWYQAVKRIGKGTGKNAWRYRREAQQHMEYSRKTIPAWIMPLYQVAETISPSAAAFDVVIVDEASQLGPEAILLLFLAKKIIIVGDDKQTSPENVGIETEKVNAAIEKHLNDIPFNTFFGLDFSFFDHAFRFCNANNNGMIVLKEHFRCMPEIIEFSNTYFYKPFRSPLYPLRQYSENRLEPLKSTHVKSGFIKGTSPNIINEPEAEKIVSAIEQCIQDAKYNEKTIGIISLQGNNQAELIEHLLVERIGPEEMENRKIVCGTSASFQGDERDIIFLSMVVARDYNFMSLTKAADERRFNVAASRARDQMWLFHSVGLDDLRSDQDLRYKLLEHFYKREESYNYYFDAAAIAIIDRATERPPSPFDSWFEVDICQKIIDKGYKVIPQYKIAYYKVDLAVILPNGAKIAVECDGDKFHGVDEYQQDILRQRTLERVGLQFFRIRGSKYYSDPEGSLMPLWNLLEKNSQYQFATNAVKKPVPAESPKMPVAPKPIEVKASPTPPKPEAEAGAANMHETHQKKSKMVSADNEEILHKETVLEQSAILPLNEIAHRLDMQETAVPKTAITAMPEQDTEISDNLEAWFRSIETDKWFKIARIAREKNILTPGERKFCFQLGQYYKEKMPSPKQLRWANKIFEKIKDNL